MIQSEVVPKQENKTSLLIKSDIVSRLLKSVNISVSLGWFMLLLRRTNVILRNRQNPLKVGLQGLSP